MCERKSGVRAGMERSLGTEVNIDHNETDPDSDCVCNKGAFVGAFTRRSLETGTPRRSNLPVTSGRTVAMRECRG
jgi:hypothetical protein